MHTLAIDTLSLVYRLPAARASEQARLERAVRRALDGPVQAALERAGIHPSEELCIRALDTSVKVPQRGSDEALSTHWSLAFAEAVRAAVEAGGAGVVRYGSLHQALWDLVDSSARGDTARSWAWAQLGLWPVKAHQSPSKEVAAGYAVATLARHAHAAPAVLAGLAARGSLAALWARLGHDALRTLVVATLQAFGVSKANAAALLELAPPPVSQGPRASSDEDEDEDGRGGVAGASSALARAAAAAHTALARTGAALRTCALSQRTLAVFVLLEAEPLVLGKPRGLLVVQALERRLFFAAEAPAPGPQAPARDSAPPRPPPEDSRSPRSAADRAQHTPGSEARPAGERLGAEGAEEWGAARQAEQERPGDVRVRAHTGSGGLLYLLNVVDELCLYDAVEEDPVFLARPLRWTLHQLAQRLGKVDASDPGALAFCGLGPKAVPPSRGEPAPTDDEDQALGRLVARVVQRTRERLGGALDQVGDALLLDTVCRRRAEVLADPGWLELVFSLDDVSTELRRAGLDLDPGWLPWLGVVVRFRHA